MKISKVFIGVASSLALLLPAASALAICTPDGPEIGDIGPSSELVCADLEHRYGDAELAVENRTILSPTTVSVETSVNGVATAMRYDLVGFDWRLDAAGVPAATAAVQVSR